MRNLMVAMFALSFTAPVAAFASRSCQNGAAAAALSQIIAELASEGRDVSKLKFQVASPNSLTTKELRNGDVLETYSALVYVFDGTNIIDGVEYPAKMSVKVVMRDVGAALCKVEKIESLGGDDIN